MNRSRFVLSIGAIICVGAAGSYSLYKQTVETNRIAFSNTLYESENRLLKDQLKELEYRLSENISRPSYEEGYRDAILRMGSPQQPGAYRDGYEAAIKALGSNNYAEGYHTAIKQFGYSGATYVIADPEKIPVKPNVTGNSP